jgi:hypothetical protein
MVVIGHSAGAWGALALASEDPKDVPPSSRSRRGAAGMPMIFPTGSARRIR